MTTRAGIVFFLLLISISLMGCGAIMPGKNQDNTERERSSSESNVEEKKEESKADLITPPKALPPQYGGELTAGSRKKLYPLMGMNIEELFSEELDNERQRLDRVENIIVDVLKDYESIKPTISRLAEVESDIQSLVSELETLLQNEAVYTSSQMGSSQIQSKAMPHSHTEPPSHNKPVAAQAAPLELHTSNSKQKPPKAAATKAKTMSPSQKLSQSSSASLSLQGLKGIRAGQHKDKVRLVFDIAQKARFKSDIDNQERILVIEFEGIKSIQELNKTLAGISLIKSYNIYSVQNGQNTQVVFSLSKATQILEQNLLPPGSSPHYRVFIDLKI